MTTHTETQRVVERLASITVNQLSGKGGSTGTIGFLEAVVDARAQEAINLLTRQQEELNNADALQAESGAIISALYLEIAELTETAKRWERRATELAFERSAYRRAAKSKK